MPRKGENIYKRKDGRWEGRYIKGHSGGKAQYGAVYAGSYRETKKKLDEAKKALENKPCAARAGNMADIGQRWLSDMSATLKESSVNKYDDLLRCYILPDFGEYEFSEITNQNIIDFTSALLSNGGVEQQGLAPSTVAEVLSTLNSIRIYALKRNCAVAFSPECVSIKREQKDIRVFSLEEQNCLLEHLRENMNPSALGILVCFFTGIRIGVSAAKGLAFAAEKPCVPVSALAAMARNAAFAGGLIVCAMDARQKQIYNALFSVRDDGSLERLTPDRAVSLADLAEELADDSRPKTIAGDGAKLCLDALNAAGISRCRIAPPHLVMQNAVSVALEAEETAKNGGLVSAQELVPVYLRPPQALTLRERQKLDASN